MKEKKSLISVVPKEKRTAIEYAHQNGVILAVAAGNEGAVMSVLGQASQEFDPKSRIQASPF